MTLARGDEPERRSFPSWLPVAANVPIFAGPEATLALDESGPRLDVPRRRGGAADVPWSPHPTRKCAASAALSDLLPKGLYARALIIIIAPIVRARKRRRLRVHGAPLATGDAPAVGGDRARHRRADRHLRRATRRRTITRSSSRSRATGSNCRCRSCRRAICPTPRPKPFFDLLDRALSDEIRTQVQAPVLDRHGRPIAPRRDPRQARQRHPALRRHALADLCLELAHLPVVDGGLVGHPADGRDPVPAQSDPSDPAARRSGRRLRQGPAGAGRFPPARRARGAPGGHRVPRDARPHHARTSSSARPCSPASATTCARC